MSDSRRKGPLTPTQAYRRKRAEKARAAYESVPERAEQARAAYEPPSKEKPAPLPPNVVDIAAWQTAQETALERMHKDNQEVAAMLATVAEHLMENRIPSLPLDLTVEKRDTEGRILEVSITSAYDD